MRDSSRMEEIKELRQLASSPEKMSESIDLTKTLNSANASRASPRASFPVPVFSVQEISSKNKVIQQISNRREAPVQTQPVQNELKQLVDLSMLPGLNGADRVSPLMKTSEKRVMAQTMQNFAEKAQRHFRKIQTSNAHRKMKINQGKLSKKPDISRGIINMKVEKLHKPSAHVLSRAVFTGGGFRSKNTDLSPVGKADSRRSRDSQESLEEPQDGHSSIGSLESKSKVQVPESFVQAPAEFLEKLTYLPSEGGKIVIPELSRRKLKAFKPLLHSGGFTPQRERKQPSLLPIANTVSFSKSKFKLEEKSGNLSNRAIELNIPSPDLVARRTAILEQRNEGEQNNGGIRGLFQNFRSESPFAFSKSSYPGGVSDTISEETRAMKPRHDIRTPLKEPKDQLKELLALRDISVRGQQKRILSNQYNGREIRRPKLPPMPLFAGHKQRGRDPYSVGRRLESELNSREITHKQMFSWNGLDLRKQLVGELSSTPRSGRLGGGWLNSNQSFTQKTVYSTRRFWSIRQSPEGMTPHSVVSHVLPVTALRD